MQLVIRDLSKRYANGVQALDRVSLAIEPGMFGLLGPNGAGKSTLMRTLATLQDADSGTATLGDIDILREPARVRRLLGNGRIEVEAGFMKMQVSADDVIEVLPESGAQQASCQRASATSPRRSWLRCIRRSTLSGSEPRRRGTRSMNSSTATERRVRRATPGQGG